MRDDPISLDDIKECLERSGYLLESRLVRSLAEQGYFVEPNQVVRDPRTGKSREIDLVAEYYNFHSERDGVCVKTTFAVEAINNRFPFVLTTERPNTPNVDVFNYLKYVCTPEPNSFEKAFDLYEERAANYDNLYSQYCAITKKKSNEDLMASHPEDTYSSLQKLAEYVEGEISWWDSREHPEADEYWRVFFWHPMLVLSGQLVIAHFDEQGQVKLKEAEMGRLEFNWHNNEKLCTTVIEVITESLFSHRLKSIVQQDDDLEGRLYSLKQQILVDTDG